MTMYQLEKSGSQFILEISSAIDKYTADQISKDANFFNFSGLDLRYAIERDLYVRCSNSDVLMMVFARKNGLYETATNIFELNIYESLIIKYIDESAIFVVSGGGESGNSSMVGACCRFLYRVAKYIFYKIFFAQKGSFAKIFFVVESAKFIRFLKPVTSNLPVGAYLYLALSDISLGRLASQLGEPWALPGLKSYVFNVDVPHALKPFRHLCDRAGALLSAASRLRPAALVVVEGNSPVDSIASEVGRTLGVPTICLQQGWSPIVHTGFRNLQFSSFYSWGDGLSEILAQINPSQKFESVGSLALSHSPCGDDACFDGIKCISFYLQAPCALISQKIFDAFLDFILSVAKKYSSISFIIREHPSYQLGDERAKQIQGLSNLSISNVEVESLSESLLKSDLVVSIFSTVVLEACGMGKASLICGIGGVNRYFPDLGQMGASHEVNSLLDAEIFLDRVIENPKLLRPYVDRAKEISCKYFSQTSSGKLIATKLMTLTN